MSKTKWIKQLTRENTLLDRSLRTLAYHQSVRELGKASISKCPVVGFNKVTSWYYSPVDFKNQQKIIFSEFKGKNIDKMGLVITKFLEQGYLWAKSQRVKKIFKKEFSDYLKESQKHHAHGRGAIVYGYWGEPIVAQKLKKVLIGKVKPSEVDHTLSILSAPRPVKGPLTGFHHLAKSEVKKQKLIKKLKLTVKEQELVKILSWFTFFYEMGEHVSSYLYDQLVSHLKKTVRNKKELVELAWYDPYSLEKYFKGKKLSQEEIKRRQKCYILKIDKNRLTILSGEKAQAYYDKNFTEKLPKQVPVIKGTVASLGKTQGIVKIIITQDDQKKMQKGDILVSTMTTPRLMTAVKKAGAIITDEGGMTAHAAIVSREFNIPCIVGTKVATKILKDGDKVVVDAERGIVKKV
ncbi:hypothetical protein KKF32_02050 [Patescibacteria group bacterium]|nr:hypothetical protein [Patescibacteria group bacterium]